MLILVVKKSFCCLFILFIVNVNWDLRAHHHRNNPLFQKGGIYLFQAHDWKRVLFF